MKKYNIAQISFLIACGSALQLAESFIPYPIPWARVGLANISTLIGLVLFGIPAGLEVAVFRPVITSLINGTFLSPGLILSFCGSISSFLVMAAVHFLTRKNRLFSLIGISIIGAIAHNMAQIALVYYWLIPHYGIIALTPLVIVSALVGGYLVGWSSMYVLDKIPEAKFDAMVARWPQPEEPSLPKELILEDKIKILCAFAMVVSTVFIETFAAYAVLILFVLALTVVSGKAVRPVFNRLLRLWGVIVFSFMLPVVLSPGGRIIGYVWIIKVTEPGIAQGILFSLRLVFLILISVWIGVTEPDKLSRELAWILSPLKYFRFSVDRIPRLTSLSLSFVPVIWEKLAHVKPKKLKTILDALVAFFVGLE